MSQYFSSSNKRGELNELHEDLNSPKFEKKKEALKKVIAHMTIGKDVSPLFQSVIKCLEVNDLEIIKLVYLYIINYSRTRPDDAIMVVNLFRKGAKNTTSPLIRALAVRTMGCIRVKKINEYLIEPLKDLLNDEDPYVKKTAVLCVPKVYEVSPELVEQHGIIDILQRMIQKEGNSLVLANLVVAFQELSEMRGGKSLLQMNFQLLQKLLLAINECIEWGQVFILDNLLSYVPSDAKEAESIIDRVIPRLAHINPAVVLSSIKVIVKYMDYMTSAENIKALCKKISPTLVTLLKQPPEIQYVTLRNINFIVEKRPHILEKDIKVFFIGFNDPYYVKAEKLEIITKLTDAKNFEIAIAELAEYVNGVDPEFGRKALKAIGKICLRVDKAAEKCISVLKNILLECNNAPHVLAESAVVFQIIYRKYPEKFVYDAPFKIMSENLQLITEPEPRGSLIWLIGEFADKIKESVDIIKGLTEYYLEEPAFVQLQILTAAVKVYLKNPDESEDLIATVLPLASENNENPDVRDRGYIYWRMLSTDPEKTKKVVLADRPIIVEESHTFEETLLNNMIENISMVASVFHKTPEQFLPKAVLESARRYVEEVEEESPEVKEAEKAEDKKTPDESKADKSPPKEKSVSKPDSKLDNKQVNIADEIDLLGMGDSNPTPKTQPTNVTSPTNNNAGSGDLLDLVFGGSTTTSTTNTSTQNVQGIGIDDDLFSLGTTTSTIESSTPVPYDVVLNENTSGQSGKKGLRVEASVLRENQKILLGLRLTNLTMNVIKDFTMQLKPNFFGLTIESVPLIELQPQGHQEVKLTISTNGPKDVTIPSPPLLLTTGMKNNLDTFYFNTPCMYHVLLDPKGELSPNDFKQYWKQIPDSSELLIDIPEISNNVKNEEGMKKLMRKNNIFFITKRTNDKNQNVYYFTSKSVDDSIFLIQISIPSLKFPGGCSISCRSTKQQLIPLFLQCSQFILKQGL